MWQIIMASLVGSVLVQIIYPYKRLQTLETPLRATQRFAWDRSAMTGLSAIQLNAFLSPQNVFARFESMLLSINIGLGN